MSGCILAVCHMVDVRLHFSGVSHLLFGVCVSDDRFDSNDE